MTVDGAVLATGARLSRWEAFRVTLKEYGVPPATSAIPIAIGLATGALGGEVLAMPLATRISIQLAAVGINVAPQALAAGLVGFLKTKGMGGAKALFGLVKKMSGSRFKRRQEKEAQREMEEVLHPHLEEISKVMSALDVEHTDVHSLLQGWMGQQEVVDGTMADDLHKIRELLSQPEGTLIYGQDRSDQTLHVLTVLTESMARLSHGVTAAMVTMTPSECLEEAEWLLQEQLMQSEFGVPYESHRYVDVEALDTALSAFAGQSLDRNGPISPLFVLLAEMGGGKTWCAAHFAHTLATLTIGEGDLCLVPFYVPLRGGLSSGVGTYFGEGHPTRVADRCRSMHAAGKVAVLILDGLHEMTTVSDRAQALPWLGQFLKAVAGHAYVILTCRSYVWRSDDDFHSKATSLSPYLFTADPPSAIPYSTIQIGDFTDTELLDAIEAYELEEYSFTLSLIHMCRRPFTLRLVSDYATVTGALPNPSDIDSFFPLFYREEDDDEYPNTILYRMGITAPVIRDTLAPFIRALGDLRDTVTKESLQSINTDSRQWAALESSGLLEVHLERQQTLYGLASEYIPYVALLMEMQWPVKGTQWSGPPVCLSPYEMADLAVWQTLQNPPSARIERRRVRQLQRQAEMAHGTATGNRPAEASDLNLAEALESLRPLFGHESETEVDDSDDKTEAEESESESSLSMDVEWTNPDPSVPHPALAVMQRLEEVLISTAQPSAVLQDLRSLLQMANTGDTLALCFLKCHLPIIEVMSIYKDSELILFAGAELLALMAQSGDTMPLASTLVSCGAIPAMLEVLKRHQDSCVVAEWVLLILAGLTKEKKNIPVLECAEVFPAILQTIGLLNSRCIARFGALALKNCLKGVDVVLPSLRVHVDDVTVCENVLGALQEHARHGHLSETSLLAQSPAPVIAAMVKHPKNRHVARHGAGILNMYWGHTDTTEGALGAGVAVPALNNILKFHCHDFDVCKEAICALGQLTYPGDIAPLNSVRCYENVIKAMDTYRPFWSEDASNVILRVGASLLCQMRQGGPTATAGMISAGAVGALEAKGTLMAGASEILLHGLQRHISDRAVCIEVVRCISTLIPTGPIKLVDTVKWSRVIPKVLEAHIEDKSMAATVAILIRRLTRNEPPKTLRKVIGVYVASLLDALTTHAREPFVVGHCLLAMIDLSEKQVNYNATMMSKKVHLHAIEAMKRFPDSYGVACGASGVLANLTDGSHERQITVVAEGALPQLMAAVDAHIDKQSLVERIMITLGYISMAEENRPLMRCHRLLRRVMRRYPEVETIQRVGGETLGRLSNDGTE
ncbi:hypothetical protein KIPB_006813 [Kipferlia bialata]|uniref:Uncharacterized protein n=1 Tax=Kipferlia bialata TaxID=797122 RepID=A0A9K3GK33_9EUKA|nr:hypothetical protein KIPB_006813 [Kipferlia bialata]|eukprot:g6813.t1